jgi:hypothetical protein
MSHAPYASDTMGLREKFSLRCHTPLNLGSTALCNYYFLFPVTAIGLESL